MGQVQIKPVRSKRDLKTFINVPWKIYAGDPNWVPPLKRMQAHLLAPQRHPYWQVAKRELFIAEQDGQAVGRIMAHIDHAHNDHHSEKMGAWGFFECINDIEVSRALFSAAEDWHRAQGAAFMRGPLNPSTNYEAAMLVDGFDSPPVLMMTYNPRYYLDLVADYGLDKEKDLLAFYGSREQWPKWDLSRAKKIAERGGITIRQRKSDILEEVKLVTKIYRECWGDNWGYIPMTEGEVAQTAKELKPLLAMVGRDWVFFLTHKGRDVAVGVVVPDFNQVIKHLNGNLGPWSLLKLLWYRRKMDNARCMMLGVPKGIRRAGFAMVAVSHILSLADSSPQYNSMELSWTLEDNVDINQMLTKGGLEQYKRYRIFRKEL